jgi:hypothetical protein
VKSSSKRTAMKAISFSAKLLFCVIGKARLFPIVEEQGPFR